MTQVTQSSAPGKLVLLGEYAVLEGAPALVAAVDRRALVTIRSTSSAGRERFLLTAPSLDIEAQRFDIDTPEHPDERMRLTIEVLREAETILRDADVELPPCALHIDTAAFHSGDHKLGLGSSAAVASALLAALLWHHAPDGRINTEASALFASAWQAHHRAQGERGSGIDVAASCHGGVLRFQHHGSERLPRIEKLGGDAHRTDNDSTHVLQAVFTGQSASTSSLLGAVQNALHHSATTRAVMDRLHELSENGVRQFRDADGVAFAQTVSEFANAMASLGSSAGVKLLTPAHERAAELAEKSGYAYKPSGAGGGDIGVAIAANKAQDASQLRQLWTAAALEPIELKVDHDGVRRETVP